MPRADSPTGFQIDMRRATRCGLRADRHAARRAERDERTRKTVAQLVQVIVVRCDAVASVTIEVQTGGVEVHAQVGPHARRRCATAAIAAIRAIGSSGFVTCDWNPAARIRSRSATRA
jgi:hypothetical protein